MCRLWARLILHFWATAVFEDAARQGESYQPDPVAYLQRAYEQTIEATSAPNDWQGTTTATGAQLHYRRVQGKSNSKSESENESGDAPPPASPGNNDGGNKNQTNESTTDSSSSSSSSNDGDDDGRETEAEPGAVEPLLYVTSLGDSQVMVIRPSTREMVYKSTEQWHWFDCPRQLGTNSPDTPAACAVVDRVPIREGDVVLAMSDGVADNLWPHEVVECVCASLDRWRAGDVPRRPVVVEPLDDDDDDDYDHDRDHDDGGMSFVAHELMEAAKAIAIDPFAESPFMERAIEEGLASEGGKLCVPIVFFYAPPSLTDPYSD